jgi:hypothetical protein
VTGRRAAALLAALLLASAWGCRSHEETASADTGGVSTREMNPDYVEIRRPKHHFRHWIWSGIFPYGGWIPDPHFAETHVMSFCREATPLIPAPARYQGFDVNPWFRDETSEVVLAIEAAGIVYEYKLHRSDMAGLRYGFVGVEKIYSFADQSTSTLLFLVNLDLARPTLIQISLPLTHDGSPVLHSKGSPEWRLLASMLAVQCSNGNFDRESCNKLLKYDEQER